MKLNKKLEDLLNKFKSVFWDAIPPGLPSQRNIDHSIHLESGSRPPNRPFFQHSPAELVDVKEYVFELLNKGNYHRSKSPFGDSLFLVKERDKS